VKVTPIGNILKIIIRESDVDVARPTLELQEEVAKFCEITDPSHVAILHWILAQDDLKEIEDILQRRGIPNDLPEFDKFTKDGTEDQSLRLSFSGLNAMSLDLESEDSLQRPYKGPKKDNQEVLPDKPESVDANHAIQSFVNQFNFASSFGEKIARPWQDVEAKTMLSHICRLENMDPFVLLLRALRHP
jgi:hypothetical protein